MVLKYMTKCEAEVKTLPEEDFRAQWNYVGEIIGASFYWDETIGAQIAALQFERLPPLTLILKHEAYLLNEDGKTIERLIR